MEACCYIVAIFSLDFVFMSEILKAALRHLKGVKGQGINVIYQANKLLSISQQNRDFEMFSNLLK